MHTKYQCHPKSRSSYVEFQNFPKKTVLGNIVKWYVPNINSIGRLKVCWIMYQNLHNVKRGQKFRQVFKVKNRNSRNLDRTIQVIVQQVVHGSDDFRWTFLLTKAPHDFSIKCNLQFKKNRGSPISGFVFGLQSHLK